jgi:hypothetical protein
MDNPPLNVRDRLAGVALVPGLVELLGRRSELDDEIAGQVLRLGLAALFAPQAEERGLIAAMMMRASEPPMQ